VFWEFSGKLVVGFLEGVTFGLTFEERLFSNAKIRKRCKQGTETCMPK
jgi:hypothetical protein